MFEDQRSASADQRRRAGEAAAPCDQNWEWGGGDGGVGKRKWWRESRGEGRSSPAEEQVRWDRSQWWKSRQKLHFLDVIPNGLVPRGDLSEEPRRLGVTGRANLGLKMEDQWADGTSVTLFIRLGLKFHWAATGEVQSVLTYTFIYYLLTVFILSFCSSRKRWNEYKLKQENKHENMIIHN